MSKVSRVIATRSFENSLKKLKKKHEIEAIQEIYNTVQDLINFKITKQKSNHPLKNAQGHKDLHLKSGKLVLLYKYEDDVLSIALRLQDVVNHDQLDGYNKWGSPTHEFDPEVIKGSTEFNSWYDSLSEEEQWEVDDIADEEGIPFYDEAEEADLLTLMNMFKSGSGLGRSIYSSRAIDAKDEDYTDRIESTLTRTLDIYLKHIEVEVDGDSIEFSSYDWAAADGDGEHESDWESVEDDPPIILDDTSGVAEKVEKLLLDRVFERVDRYRSFTINECTVELVYIVPDVQYEASGRGVYTRQGNVNYNKSDIFWSEADSTIDCDYRRL